MENGKLRLRAEAELLAEQQSKEQLDAVSSVELREDAAWNPSETPSLSLVFSHGENLWELAKEYRSTIEAISSCNPEGGNPLLIPAE